uniref:Osiris 17 n=1 Tax=Glossina morsitans morsitans TaxID=37546 RepID=A0A1B0FL86_GLOMM
MCKKMQKRLKRIQSNTNLITSSTLKANVHMTRTKQHRHTVMTKIVHILSGKEGKNCSSFQKMNNNRNRWSERRTGLSRKCRYYHSWLLLPLVFSIVIEARLYAEKVNDLSLSTTTTSSIDYQRSNNINSSTNSTPSEILSNATNATIPTADWLRNDSLAHQTAYQTVNAFNKAKSRPGDGGGGGGDSIFARFAKRFASGNELWDGIVRECYTKPSFTCFQKNVYVYLSDVLDAKDMNVTQALKFYHNTNSYQRKPASKQGGEKEQLHSTEASAAKDYSDSNTDGDSNTLDNEIFANTRRNHFSSTDAATEGAETAETPEIAETPIEEVTNALYEKSVKFAITHDVELKLPDILFDGATFRISPRSLEGNGMVAKLELIPRQQIEARLAGKILFKKIQKLLQSKLLLSFLALILIVKIIKIKIFWLLPFIIGVTAAKKLLLKFLLFLFPALSHLFKLCSYYQQTYHSTKYHHHHHLINHHHTIVPAWHGDEHVPEIIYTSPPKGHVSTYLHGAPPPLHESYKPNSHDHYDGSWELSGPGLGSEFINDINRVAHVDESSDYFKPHLKNDVNELHDWGLGTTQANLSPKQQVQQKQKHPIKRKQQTVTQLPRLPITSVLHKPPPSSAQPQNFQKPQATSQTFNPFLQNDHKQSGYGHKYKNNLPAQSALNSVYAAPAHLQGSHKPQSQNTPLTAAAQIIAQYDPNRNQQQQHLQTKAVLTPEIAAQLKEALRIQTEQRLIQQQQKILDKQPFAQDGQPLMPLNYDQFYSPILLKIDKVIEQLGVTDDLCKERLVCSMYKDPARYSPHSNFVSAELSRDTNELAPVKNTNTAVIRFFRLIQAARDGQDQKDCLRLYPNCNINTE